MKNTKEGEQNGSQFFAYSASSAAFLSFVVQKPESTNLRRLSASASGLPPARDFAGANSLC